MYKVSSVKLRPVAWALSLAALASASAVAAKNLGDWSAPANIETLPGSSQEVNSPSIEGCASVSPDGLDLVFNSFRSGNQEIWLASRSSTSEGFGDPVMLSTPVNTPSQEFCPTIRQGKRLYFSRNAAGSGGGDIYVSRMGPDGWSEPELLGPEVNSSTMVEESPTFYEDDEGRDVIVFSRRPAGPFVGPGGKLYQSVGGAPATLVQGGPHSSSSDNRPSVTNDGRTIFWDSLRSGPPGIWYATRSAPMGAWGDAVHLSHLGAGTRPYVSWKGELLIISAANDIAFSSREKITGRDE